MAKMWRLYEMGLLSLLIMSILIPEMTCIRKSSSNKKTSSTSSKVTLTQEEATPIQEDIHNKIQRGTQELEATQTKILVVIQQVAIQQVVIQQVAIQQVVIQQQVDTLPEEVILINTQVEGITQIKTPPLEAIQLEEVIQTKILEGITLTNIQGQGDTQLQVDILTNIQVGTPEVATQSEGEIQDRVGVCLGEIQGATPVEQEAVTPTGTQTIRSSVPGLEEEAMATPKSTNFAKKAMLAAGVGAVAGMAVGYGLGRFPRPHFNFRNPEEEQYYNNYMYRRYGTQSTDQKDYGRDYVYKPPPRAESYESFMSRCMNSSEPLKEKGSSPSPSNTGANEDDDTVSIEEIGYPALIEQVKSRRCVEQYMIYSERFLQERKFEQQIQHSHGSPLNYGVMQLLTSCLMLLSSMLLLQ
ncbi:unnamed protein product [Menidia menidia]|uniref:(Atlantic silverside) hypothetical protein n=1 Tax=Menidia menidia TaxID=238744 RepID=A0A8S4ANX8_9TELE|nr:unnamed protein product [Menidia menidia]